MRHSKPLIVLAFAACCGGGGAAAQTAADFMAEGNQLVRSGVYRTALVRYREAAAAGLDTPLLHYNIGVVHYELGDFAESADEFARAAAEPALASLATYNRGLALRAAGDMSTAREAFQAAAETADDRDLRRLAESAAGEPVAAAPRASAARRQRVAESEPRIGALQLSVAARMGQDDNIYRGPSEPYVDLSDPAQPLVTPEVFAASFVPLELHVAYVLGNEAGDTEFMFRYDLDAVYYDGLYFNATEADGFVSMGANILLGEDERRRRSVQTAFFIGTHGETNFDPDDGVGREIEVEVDDEIVVEELYERFSYQAAGVEGHFTHTLGRFTWGLDMRFERDEYADTEFVANYDQDVFYTGVDVDYDFSDVMALHFGLRQYRTLYDERPARDLTGALLDTNPAQEYSHSGVQLGITRQLGRAVELGADYLVLERIDEFFGYYDYTQDVLRLRVGFKPTPRFDLHLAALARSYDYPNAFAFNVAAGGTRELEETGIALEGAYRITPRLTLWAELDSLDVTSTDARAAYARTKAMLGVEWRK